MQCNAMHAWMYVCMCHGETLNSIRIFGGCPYDTGVYTCIYIYIYYVSIMLDSHEGGMTISINPL